MAGVHAESDLSTTDLRIDLARLARFGANISDSFSCFIFLPHTILNPQEPEHPTQVLEIGGFHSLSNQVLVQAKLPIGFGLVGWVSKNSQPIHVSPFERDSTTLGIYSSDQQLKSFIGIPVSLQLLGAAAPGYCGVIACDSKKSFAFSKLQGKLLEDLANETSNTVRLYHRLRSAQSSSASWSEFAERASQLAQTLGPQALEVVRLHIANLSDFEFNLGPSRFSAWLDQIYRLIQQALPPHFPVYRSASGDYILVTDSMMTSFYQNKITALKPYFAAANLVPDLIFTKRSVRAARATFSLEELVRESAEPSPRIVRRSRAAHG
jgi:hypothetical protein